MPCLFSIGGGGGGGSKCSFTHSLSPLESREIDDNTNNNNKLLNQGGELDTDMIYTHTHLQPIPRRAIGGDRPRPELRWSE